MVKKNRKRTGYSLIVASGLLLLVGVLLYGLYYVNDVRTELWDSSLSTIIENTDRASDMVAGKINAEKRSLQVQVNALESLDSTDTDTISFLLNTANIIIRGIAISKIPASLTGTDCIAVSVLW